MGLLALLLAACTALVQSTPAGTEVTVTPVAGGTLVHIRSPQGIGRAVVTFPGGLPDGELAFRLDLRGLERFEIVYGGTVISASVLPDGGSSLVAVRHSAGEEAAVTPDSPYWLATRLVSATPQPYYLVQAPPDLLARRPATLELAWVDFYR
ncbi:MAG TPA: hypothetical protein VNK95_09445 [Caldilineaceae bacterium]|nr:hypothetical protein [Caldilineaceae bacterium]